MTEEINARVLKVAVWAAFISWLFLFINALFPYIQMFMFDGKVLLLPIFFKISFFIFCLVAFCVNKKLMPERVLILWAVLVCYLCLHGFYMVYVLGYTLKYVLFGYNAYYYYFVILPILPSLSGVIPVRSVLRVLMLVFIPVAVVGVLQYCLNAPVLPVRSSDGRFILGSYNFFGKMRPTSFFAYPGLFSFYLVFMVFVFLGVIKACRKWSIFAGLCACVALFLIFVSYSRSTYVFVFTLLPAALLLFTGETRYKAVFLKYLPAVYIPVTASLVFLLSLFIVKFDPAILKLDSEGLSRELAQISGNLHSANKSHIDTGHLPLVDWHFFNSTDVSADVELCSLSQPKLTSGYSFLMRIHEWKVFGKLAFFDQKTLMLGNGYLQNGRLSAAKDFLVDNLYLNIVLHIGIIGLFLVLSLLWSFWRYLIETIERDFFSKALIIMFSTITVLAFSGMILMDYMCFALVLFFIAGEKAVAKATE